jgi:hypothetical protein
LINLVSGKLPRFTVCYEVLLVLLLLCSRISCSPMYYVFGLHVYIQYYLHLYFLFV